MSIAAIDAVDPAACCFRSDHEYEFRDSERSAKDLGETDRVCRTSPARRVRRRIGRAAEVGKLCVIRVDSNGHVATCSDVRAKDQSYVVHRNKASDGLFIKCSGYYSTVIGKQKEIPKTLNCIIT